MLFQRSAASTSPETLPEATTAPKTLLPPAVYQQLERLYGSTQTAPEVIDLLLQYGAVNGVSDLIIEPYEHAALVRVRLDGILHEVSRIPAEMCSAVISRIKVLANLDSSSLREVAQEGKFVLRTEKEPVTVRVAIAQVAGGEMVALRLHDSSTMSGGLSDHGMPDSIVQQYTKLLQAKSGLILVCGPTGGGKTSTLYSSLQILNTGMTNIISIEDPVEYILPGINQMEVNAEFGLSFARGLRVTLRLNPDIIFVGEIRDQETARIAMESSLTGHLVLSTLHANSAVSAISRLRDLEIERFFISASLKAALCQRLVRRSCTICGTWNAPQADEAALFEQMMHRPLEKQFSSPGCEACAGTGFKGRIGIYEIIVVNDGIRTLISNAQSEDEMSNVLRKNGFHSLLEDGLEKVEQGLTTVVEVVSHAYSGD